jgi:hypothetical protein
MGLAVPESEVTNAPQVVRKDACRDYRRSPSPYLVNEFVWRRIITVIEQDYLWFGQLAYRLDSREVHAAKAIEM